MGEIQRFDLYVNLRSWALPLAIHYQPGGSNSGLSIQIGPACFIFHWGPDLARRAGVQP